MSSFIKEKKEKILNPFITISLACLFLCPLVAFAAIPPEGWQKITLNWLITRTLEGYFVTMLIVYAVYKNLYFTWYIDYKKNGVFLYKRTEEESEEIREKLRQSRMHCKGFFKTIFLRFND